MVLSSLEATIAKLGADETRHSELVKTMQARMKLSDKVTRKSHRRMTFAQSNYVFLHLLGEGRFGMVKLAKKKSNEHVQHAGANVRRSSFRNRQSVDMDFVAIRIIMQRRAAAGRLVTDDLLSTKESHAALMKNVEALRSLDHPGICRVLESFEDGQNIFIVMEWYSGGHLLQEETQPMSEERAAGCMSQIVSAIAFAHEHNVVHQDLRLENIRYATADPDAPLVICDWSCAEFIDASPTKSRHELIRTEFSAPELVPSHRTDRGDVWSIGVLAYALVTLQLPFRMAPHDFDARTAILPRGVQLSEPCLDFVTQLLQMEPTRRLSARQAYGHEWLASAQRIERQQLPKRESLDAMTASLLTFGSKGSLQRAAATFIASHLSGSQLHELTLAFKAADKNGDGSLDREELQALLKDQMGKVDDDLRGSSEERAMQVEALFAAVDSDESGQISYSEFLAAASDSIINQNVHLCWEAFHAFDRDNSGRLSIHEVTELLETHAMQEAIGGVGAGLGQTVADAKEQFKAYDDNGDGALSFEEFMDVVMGHK